MRHVDEQLCKRKVVLSWRGFPAWMATGVTLTIVLTGCGPTMPDTGPNVLVAGDLLPDVNDYWAETTAVTLPATNLRPAVVIAGAMHWNDTTSCGAVEGEPEFLGSGWVVMPTDDGPWSPQVHGGSEFPMPAACPYQAGDPKLATDGTNIFYAQMCNTSQPTGSVPGKGVVVAISSDDGATFGDICLLCESTSQSGRACGTSNNWALFVDAPDLYYDRSGKQLVAAWDNAEGTIFYSKNTAPYDPGNPGDWCDNWGLTREMSGFPTVVSDSQYGPAVTSLPVAGLSPLIIAYHTYPFAPSGTLEFYAAVEQGPLESPQAVAFEHVLLEAVGIQIEVADEQIRQPPRPDILRRDEPEPALVVAYPAFDSTTGSNEVRTAVSADGGKTWSQQDLPINVPNGHDRFFPTLAGAERHVLLTYYQTGGMGEKLSVQAATLNSDNGGWSLPSEVTDVAPYQPCVLGFVNYYGHYLGTTPLVEPDRFWPFWADSRTILDNVRRTELWTSEVVP